MLCGVFRAHLSAHFEVFVWKNNKKHKLKYGVTRFLPDFNVCVSACVCVLVHSVRPGTPGCIFSVSRSLQESRRNMKKQLNEAKWPSQSAHSAPADK